MLYSRTSPRLVFGEAIFRDRPQAALQLLSKAATNARFTDVGDVQITCDKRSRSGPLNRRPNDESVYLRARNQSRQAGDEVQRFQHDVGRPVPERLFVAIDDSALAIGGQAFGGNRQAPPK